MKTHKRSYLKLFVIYLIFLVGLSAIFPVYAQTPQPPEPSSLTVVGNIYLPMVIGPTRYIPPPTPTPNPTGVPTPPPNSTTYYISPTGNDNNSGTSEDKPWATFNHAWQFLYPGDTLILLNGTYYQTINPNVRNGEPGRPITIRAKNDGKAVIDGEYKRSPIHLGDTWPGPIGNYFVLEGLVAKNSSGYVIEIDGAHHNILRRISAYNADTNGNDHVIAIDWSTAHDNLIEDCIASGSGRKMIVIYEGHNNTIRRCFVDWRAWDGRDFCGVTWPFGDGIQVYSGDYNIIENSISYGLTPDWAVSVQANDPSLDAIGNKILGTFALRAGMNPDGTVTQWPSVRPEPNSCPSYLTDFGWPGERAGFVLYGQGVLKDNLFQDIFSWGNAGWGLTAVEATNNSNSNNVVKNATIFNNGLDLTCGAPYPCAYGGQYTDITQYPDYFSPLTIQNSYVQNVYVSGDYAHRVLTTLNGEGARLTYRYVDGVLMDGTNGQPAQPLWPWPMEDRIQAELGISVTNFMTQLINSTP